MVVHVIRDKKTGTEIRRFTGLNERAFRGLMMKVDMTRFKVGIHANEADADTATLKLTKELSEASKLKRDARKKVAHA